MSVSFYEFISFSSCFNFISNKLSALTLKQKVGLMAITILGSFAVYYFSSHRFHAQNLNPQGDLEESHTEETKADHSLLNAQSQKVDKVSRMISKKEEPLQNDDIKESIHAKTLLHRETTFIDPIILPHASLPAQNDEIKEEKLKYALSEHIPSGKMKAIGIYRKNPKQCGRIQKSIIFKDIKYIESRTYKNDVTSVVDLMLYISELDEVDLINPLCSQVILDTFKECNKETSEQLSEWLDKQKTFHVDLLKELLTVLIEKDKQQIPFSLYSIETLLKIYKAREWNLEEDKNKKLSLPINHDLLISSMGILIQNRPNEDRIIALTEWFMNQPQYHTQIFTKWVKIFQSKEAERGYIHIHYPLLNKMVDHFDQKWGKKGWDSLDSDVMNYLLLRQLPISNV